MHEKVRKEIWGYAKNETGTIQDFIEERYQGIRPAPGYPACPDHTEKPAIFDLLGVTGSIGIRLTETFVMNPAASVCGLYFAHPAAKYFSVGKALKDQIEDYSARKKMPLSGVEKMLSANLQYQ